MHLSLCVYSMFLCPLRPTLFPYTTLFRSTEHFKMLRAAAGGRNTVLGLPAVQIHRLPFVAEQIHRRRAVQLQGVPGDRKSTRLNSSHVCISYAVFCLKIKI